MGDIWVEDCPYCGGIHTNQWAYDRCVDLNAEAGQQRDRIVDEARRATPRVDKPEPYN